MPLKSAKRVMDRADMTVSPVVGLFDRWLTVICRTNRFYGSMVSYAVVVIAIGLCPFVKFDCWLDERQIDQKNPAPTSKPRDAMQREASNPTAQKSAIMLSGRSRSQARRPHPSEHLQQLYSSQPPRLESTLQSVSMRDLFQDDFSGLQKWLR
jgi:hypothetical protein